MITFGNLITGFGNVCKDCDIKSLKDILSFILKLDIYSAGQNYFPPW